MTSTDTDHGFNAIRDAIRALCKQFPDQYFRRIDAERGYPEAFVDALTKAGWLAALIPEAYGGAGLGLAEASVVMEEINRAGGNSGACHGQMYNWARCCAMAPTRRRRATCRASPVANGGCNRWQ